jgi:Cu+-exporting ATPase
MPTDPVCKMQVNEHEAASKSTYEGRTYYFCAVACKEEFDRNPEHYAGRSIKQIG